MHTAKDKISQTFQVFEELYHKQEEIEVYFVCTRKIFLRYLCIIQGLRR